MLKPVIAGKTINEAMVRRISVYQQLGDHHRCTVDFSRDDLVAAHLEEFLGQPVVIEASVSDGQSVKVFEGFVSGGTLEHQLHGGTAIVLEGSSQSSKLDWSCREAYYRQKTLSQVAQDLGGKNKVKVAVNGSGGSALNYVQRGETDFEFLRRLADDCGCFIRPAGDGAEIRKGFNGSGLKLTWNEDLLLLQVSGRLNSLTLRGAHYDSKQKKGMRFQKIQQDGSFTGAYESVVSAVRNASAAVLPSQEHLEYHNARTVTLEDYRKGLERESGRALGASITVEGQSRNPRLFPGESVEIEKAPEGVGKYGLVRVIHEYDAASGYLNHFVATPWQEYSSSLKPARVPSLGLVTAMVVENNDPAKMDRLKIRYHWQEDGATSWTRMLAPYTGKERGIMFLPEVGDEVVVAFEHGDPERPIVIGSLWNGKDVGPRSPYRSDEDIKNNEVKRIITKTGNTIEIIDTAGKEVIEIYTPKKDCWIQLNNDKKAISLHSEKDILIEAPNGEVRISCKKLIADVSQDAFTTIQGKNTTQVTGDHTLEAANIKETAQQNVKIKGMMIDELASTKFTMVGTPIDLNPLVPPIDVALPIMKPAANLSEWKVGSKLAPGAGAVYEAVVGGVAGKLAFDRPEKKKVEEKKTWIEIELVDDEGKAVPSEKYRVELPDGSIKEGMLDSAGRARIDGVDPGSCKVTFPERDARDWKKV